jgi:hypothetical protein
MKFCRLLLLSVLKNKLHIKYRNIVNFPITLYKLYTNSTKSARFAVVNLRTIVKKLPTTTSNFTHFLLWSCIFVAAKFSTSEIKLWMIIKKSTRILCLKG